MTRYGTGLAAGQTPRQRLYYREFDLWLDLDGTTTALDRDEFAAEISAARMPTDWAVAVDDACQRVTQAAAETVHEDGPNLDHQRDPGHGLPRFILRA